MREGEYAMGRLPHGFTELEYIKSTGTQFLLTDLVPKFDTVYEIDMQATSISKFSCIIGCRDENMVASGLANFLAFPNSRTIRSDYYGHTASMGFSTFDRHVLLKESNSVYADGSFLFKTAESKLESALPIVIFGMYNVDSPDHFTVGTLYHAKILKAKDGRSLDGYPCIHPDGNIGMYDIISNTFIPNGGPDPFIPGPVIEYAPDPPKNLRYNMNGNQITVAWDLVDDAQAYRVYRDDTFIFETGNTQFSEKFDSSKSALYSIESVSDQGVSIKSSILTNAFYQVSLGSNVITTVDKIRLSFSIEGSLRLFQFPFCNNSLKHKTIIFMKEE